MARCTRCGRSEADGARLSWRVSRRTGRPILASSWCGACRAQGNRERLGLAAALPGEAAAPRAARPVALADHLARRAAEYAGHAARATDPTTRRRCLRAARDYRALAAEVAAGGAF